MVKRVGKVDEGNIKTYQCDTTDVLTNFPTATDCAAGSTMLVIDQTTHKISQVKYFDGTNWNSF